VDDEPGLHGLARPAGHQLTVSKGDFVDVADEQTQAFERMLDHWYWRPGWRVRRALYTWHVTFPHATDLHRLAGLYRAQFAALPGLDPIPHLGSWPL